MSIEKDKYLTPAHSLKSTRSSHSAQYCRYQTNSDALKNSFFPRTIPQWNSLSPSVVNSQNTESLGHSSFSQKHSRKIFFLQSSRFALPDVMIKIWLCQYYKKERERKKMSTSCLTICRRVISKKFVDELFCRCVVSIPRQTAEASGPNHLINW